VMAPNSSKKELPHTELLLLIRPCVVSYRDVTNSTSSFPILIQIPELAYLLIPRTDLIPSHQKKISGCTLLTEYVI